MKAEISSHILLEQGRLLYQAGQITDAQRVFALVVDADPLNAEAHWRHSLTLLARGDYVAGWREFEWRLRLPGCGHSASIIVPRWDGSRLEGRSILLHAGQGLGDTLQFVRYVPMVKQLGGRVFIACHRELLPILRAFPGVEGVIGQGDAIPITDYHAPLMSLPAILGTTLATVPAEVPYLSVDTTLVEHWRQSILALDGTKVGICWQGNQNNAQDHERSFHLSAFAPLASLPGVTLVSLQKGPGVEQLEGALFPIVNFGERLDASDSFLDTASIMQSLDLVISADTAPAHLAGALGRPVWVPLPFAPDWRWIMGRNDSPWYPTMKLFRQKTAGDWSPVFQRIAAELRDYIDGG